VTNLVNEPKETNFEDYKILVLILSSGIKNWLEMNKDKFSSYGRSIIIDGLDSLIAQLGKA
jgi:hypothetical protein